MAETWKETRLWDALKKRTHEHDEDAVRLAVVNSMPIIEEILRSGGTTPRSFTLHDDRHSFRVAERIVELLPDGGLEKLSKYELGLLLMAAYLHDIGKSPAFRTLQKYEEFLCGI